MSMRDRAKKTTADVNKKLEKKELMLLLTTELKTKKLSPDITLDPHFNDVMKAISKATDSNNDTALLTKNIEEIGEVGWELASKIIKII